MPRERFIVEVDLDSFPGTFHTKESALEIIQKILDQRIGHYNPEVTSVQK